MSILYVYIERCQPNKGHTETKVLIYFKREFIVKKQGSNQFKCTEAG